MSLGICTVQLENKPDVGELYRALKGLTDWKSFSLNLKGLQIHHIQEIQKNEKNLTDCKNDLYMKWLQVCPDAKWLDVVTALRAIEEHALADTLTGSTGGTSHTHSTTDTPIDIEHPTGIYSNHGITQQLQTTGNIPKTITMQPTAMTETIIDFPTTSETENQIVEQLNELYESFILLLQDVHKHIEMIQSDKLHQIAVNLEIADLDDSLANISRCKSMEDMWQRIQRVSNFLDGSVLHDIVKLGLHDKALASRAKEHMRKAETLRSQAPLRILRDKINIEKSQSPSQTTIVIQLNEAWGRLQLKCITQLINNIITNNEDAKMTFIKVRSGSIIVTILAKKFIATCLIEQVQQKTQFMHITGVVELTLDDNTIFQESKNNSYTFEQGLLEASVTGHLQAVQFILCLQVNIDFKDNEGKTALILASQNGHIEIMKALLSAGANVNIQDNNGLTAVMLAKRIDIYQTLVQANADTSIVTHKGSTPLYISCLKGNHEVANYLLFTLKQDITTRPDGSSTLLMAASQGGNFKIVEHLLENGHDQNIQNSRGETVVLLACLKGHYTVAELLLKHNADPNIPTNDGWTPLMVASQEGHLKIIQLLLKHEIRPNTANTKNGTTALIQASQNGHHCTAELLLSNGADPNIQDSDGRTALQQACLNGHYTVTELLLKHTAHPNITDDDGWTPLLAACQEGHYKIIELLIPKASDLTVVNLKYSMTAIMLAGMKGHLETVKILLKLWNNLNKQDVAGRTALHFATRNNHYNVVQHLLDNSADPNIPDYEGHTPLMIASQKGHCNIAKLLLHNDANPNCINFNTGTVPLIYATENNHHTIVHELLDYGADPNIQNNDGRTALELASLYGYYQIVQLLLNIDHTNTNLHTKEGWTPLMAASQEGHYKIVELLLQKGADLNARNKYNGKTALIQASKNGHHQTVQLLLKASARDNEGLTAEEQALVGDHNAVLQLLQNNRSDSTLPTNQISPPRN